MKTRATPVGDTESEACQFAFNGFLKVAFQGSRVTSHRSSRAGVGSGKSAEAKSEMSVQRLVGDQAWNAKTPRRTLRII